MVLKDFLRLDWRRVLLFFVLVFFSVMVLYVLFELSGFYLTCDPLPCSGLEVFSHWLTYNIGLSTFTIVLVADYLVSCLLVYGWGRFGWGGVVLSAGGYLNLQRFCIVLGLFFIFMNGVVRSSFLFAVGFFLLSLPFLADLCLAFVDFRGDTFRYARYYRLYSTCMFSSRSPYTLEFRRRLLRECILGNMFVVLLILLGFLVFSGVFG